MLFFISTRNSLAGCTACVPPGTFGPGIICDPLKQCVVIGGSYFNCDSPADCTNLQSRAATPIPGGAGAVPAQNPTCGGATIGTQIDTAIGCIDFQDTVTFTGTILKWLVGIGGGVAFLLILSGAFTIMTSSGNPERLKQGQDVITAAVSGLILLIFSIFILKFIGIDILGLGTFGFGP